MSSLIYPKHSMCRKETWKISEQRGRTAESAFFIAADYLQVALQKSSVDYESCVSRRCNWCNYTSITKVEVIP